MLKPYAQGLSGTTAVCGVGLKIGKFPELTAMQLAVGAYQEALDDAGMDRKDVDGIMMLSMGPDYDRFLEAVGADGQFEVFEGEVGEVAGELV